PTHISLFLFFFFFQAEDGIRDLIVTGVQTCALPIFRLDPVSAGESDSLHAADADATQDDRVPDVQTADGPEPGGVDRLRPTDVGTREPQGAAYHDRERRDHDEADDELVLALHPGRPSMNCRTT